MELPVPQPVDALPDLNLLPELSRYSFQLHVAHTADGSELSLPVNMLIGRQPGPRLLMIAGVHGNEYEGITAQLELWSDLDPAEITGTIVMVPVANPPAFRAVRRRNPEDELDMNRVFPGDQQKSTTHRLADRIFRDILPGTDLLLSMHGWSATGTILPYVEYPKQGPVTGASRDAARAFGLEYIEAFDWIPGLLVERASRAGIPAIEPEIGGANMTQPEFRSLYRRGAFNLMKHLEMIAGEPQGCDDPKEVTRTEMYARAGGVFLRSVETGQTVSAGQKLGVILDFYGRQLAEFLAPQDGLVASVHLQASIQPGDVGVMLFHPQGV
jgi:predicted deacylase